MMAAFNYLNRLSHHYDPSMAVSMPQLTIPIPSAPASIANTSTASLSTWLSLSENSAEIPLVNSNPTTNPTPSTNTNTCPHCSKSFKRKSELQRHLRVHSGEKPFVCSICSKAFASRGSLTQHEKRHPEFNSWPPNSSGGKYQAGANNQANNPKFCSQCQACQANGGRKILRCPHQSGGGGGGVVNTANMDAYQLKNRCDYCGKGFRKKTVLTEHLKIHTGERPFICTQCGKSFAHKHHLNQHSNLHTGKKPFRCTECDEAFSHSYSLARHRRSHRRFPNNLNLSNA